MRIASQICLHFDSRRESKYRFGSVQPSTATVTRTVAFRWFKSGHHHIKKRPIPNGIGLFLELLARFELATSSLPRMRSTDRAIAALCADQLQYYTAWRMICQGIFRFFWGIFLSIHGTPRIVTRMIQGYFGEKGGRNMKRNENHFIVCLSNSRGLSKK